MSNFIKSNWFLLAISCIIWKVNIYNKIKGLIKLLIKKIMPCKWLREVGCCLPVKKVFGYEKEHLILFKYYRSCDLVIWAELSRCGNPKCQLQKILARSSSIPSAPSRSQKMALGGGMMMPPNSSFFLKQKN